MDGRYEHIVGNAPGSAANETLSALSSYGCEHMIVRNIGHINTIKAILLTTDGAEALGMQPMDGDAIGLFSELYKLAGNVTSAERHKFHMEVIEYIISQVRDDCAFAYIMCSNVE
jgi:hypothetical protein